jgi:hypothetical protein
LDYQLGACIEKFDEKISLVKIVVRLFLDLRIRVRGILYIEYNWNQLWTLVLVLCTLNVSPTVLSDKGARNLKKIARIRKLRMWNAKLV